MGFLPASGNKALGIRETLISGGQQFDAYATQVLNQTKAHSLRGIKAQEFSLPRPYHVRRSGIREDAILRATMTTLSHLKIWHRRIQVQGVLQRKSVGEAIFRPSSMTGMPDLILCHVGEFWGVEVKAPGGKVSSIQLQTLKEIEAAGGEACIVASCDGLQRVFAGSEPVGYVDGIGVW